MSIADFAVADSNRNDIRIIVICMKAKVFAAPKPGLIVEQSAVDVREPRGSEVLIKIRFCGVGRGDVSFLRNDYGIKGEQRYPLVAGHEFVGQVEACGSNVDGLQNGDWVGVGYQVWSCGECEYCERGAENLCAKQRCLVLNEQGAFSDKKAIDYRFAVKLPEHLQSARGAPWMCSGLTVYSAIKKGTVMDGMVVAFVGLGGLGHLGAMLCRSMGAQVSVFTSKSSASELLQEAGVDHAYPYESSDAPKTSFDRIFITSPASVDYDYYLSLLRPDGELWAIGSDPKRTLFSSWLLNDFASRSIRGSYIGSMAELRELVEFVGQKALKPKVRVMPMTKLNKALRLMKDGNEFGRIVVENDL